MLLNNNLVEQVATIYNSLVKDKEPNDIFSSIATIESGKRPVETENGNYPLVGAGGVMNHINSYNYEEKILVTGRVGTHGVIQRFSDKCWASDNTLVIKSKYYEFSYHFLKKVDYSLLNRGSTQPLITQTDIKNLPVYIPTLEELIDFENNATKIMYLYSENLKEIQKLEHLTTLMQGQIASKLSH